jgi:hypothetical protein
MKEVCKQFAAGIGGLRSGTQNLITAPLESALSAVARAFVDLQEERHRADYDLSSLFNRVDVLQKVALAEQAFTDWSTIRGAQNAGVFLAALLMQRRWNR